MVHIHHNVNLSKINASFYKLKIKIKNQCKHIIYVQS